MDKIYKLKLHEVTFTDNFIILRVPGGWVYFQKIGPNMDAKFGCFVPFNNEFMGGKQEVEFL